MLSYCRLVPHLVSNDHIPFSAYVRSTPVQARVEVMNFGNQGRMEGRGRGEYRVIFGFGDKGALNI